MLNWRKNFCNILSKSGNLVLFFCFKYDIFTLSDMSYKQAHKMTKLCYDRNYDMASVASQKRYKLEGKRFSRSFLLWCLGIPVNTLPVLFKQINTASGDTFPGIAKLGIMTISDFDFSFISVSVLFILCIEGFFVEDEIIRRFPALQILTFASFSSLLILYCIFFFKPDWFANFSTNVKINYNKILILITLILGFLCNISLSMKVSE